MTDLNPTAIARKAFIFGYPLMLMDVTRRVATAVSGPTPSAAKAPVNQFCHLTALPDHTFRDVVRPNVDTLYSIAWLDLQHEPMVLRLPDMAGRYFLMPMLDAWTNVFASPGTRTTGDSAADFVITGPGWEGILPSDLRQLQAPTDMVWIIGRTQVNGPEDVTRVSEQIQRYELLPLHARGSSYRPPEVPFPADQDLREPMFQVAEMDVRGFLRNVAELMVRNPPAAADAPILEEMAHIGIQPGRVDDSLLSSLSDEELDAAKEEALKEMKSSMFSIGKKVNGWNISLQDMGSYGTHYLTRATVALFGLGANLPEDAVYPSNPGIDAAGQPLDSANSYQIHFAPDQIPPVHAFWSLTMYDEKGFLVENPISRYALGDRDPLTFNQDGSLDLWIQRESPGQELESNWLPCPASGRFAPTLRLYWPKDAVLSGAWQPPGIKRIG